MNTTEQRTGICGLCGGSCPIQAQVENETILSGQKLEGHSTLAG